MTGQDENPFADPDFVDRYVDGPIRFVPGHGDMRRMAAQLLAEDAGGVARILVVGAGGGIELLQFAEAQPGWTFVGVDPSAQMLELARRVLGHHAERCQLVEGTIAAAPPGPFDGASCLLTLHLIPDDGSKLATLREIKERLRPAASLVLVDNCIDRSAPDFQRKFDRFLRFARDNGAPRDDIELARERILGFSHMIGRAREEELLAEAGFCDAEIFYAGFAWTGWHARAPG